MYRVLVGKTERKRPLGRPSSRWEININLLKPLLSTGFKIQEILLADYIAFVCSVWLSEQTTTFCLLLHKLTGFYNRSGDCLLRGTH